VTTFAYTTGNPNNLVGGQTASMGDIQGPFTDLATFINSFILPQLAAISTQIGEIRFIAVNSTPTLWLPANGAAVSRTTYSLLFAAVGTVYGTGDGVNTFNVPDLAGRAPIGAGTGSGLTARTAGTKLGAQTISLSAMPTHSHNQSVRSGPSGVGGEFIALSNGTGSLTTQTSTTQGSGAADGNMPPTTVIPAYIYAGA